VGQYYFGGNTYERGGQRTIVQETLAGSVRDDVLYLTGVNYSYVEQGESASYSLDNFKLKADKHGNALVGKAMLLNGERSATFTRTAPSSPVV